MGVMLKIKSASCSHSSAARFCLDRLNVTCNIKTLPVPGELEQRLSLCHSPQFSAQVINVSETFFPISKEPFSKFLHYSLLLTLMCSTIGTSSLIYTVKINRITAHLEWGPFTKNAAPCCRQPWRAAVPAPVAGSASPGIWCRVRVAGSSSSFFCYCSAGWRIVQIYFL